MIKYSVEFCSSIPMGSVYELAAKFGEVKTMTRREIMALSKVEDDKKKKKKVKIFIQNI